MEAVIDNEGDLMIPKKSNAGELFLEWLDLSSNEYALQMVDTRCDAYYICVGLDLPMEDRRSAILYINASLKEYL